MKGRKNQYVRILYMMKVASFQGNKKKIFYIGLK